MIQPALDTVTVDPAFTAAIPGPIETVQCLNPAASPFEPKAGLDVTGSSLVSPAAQPTSHETDLEARYLRNRRRRGKEPALTESIEGLNPAASQFEPIEATSSTLVSPVANPVAAPLVRDRPNRRPRRKQVAYYTRDYLDHLAADRGPAFNWPTLYPSIPLCIPPPLHPVPSFNPAPFHFEPKATLESTCSSLVRPTVNPVPALKFPAPLIYTKHDRRNGRIGVAYYTPEYLAAMNHANGDPDSVMIPPSVYYEWQ